MRSHLTKKRSRKDRENYLFQEDSQGCAQSGECRVGRKHTHAHAHESTLRGSIPEPPRGRPSRREALEEKTRGTDGV